MVRLKKVGTVATGAKLDNIAAGVQVDEGSDVIDLVVDNSPENTALQGGWGRMGVLVSGLKREACGTGQRKEQRETKTRYLAYPLRPSLATTSSTVYIFAFLPDTPSFFGTTTIVGYR